MRDSVKEIRIYIEGGPKDMDAEGMRQFKIAFREFFRDLQETAWDKKIKLEVIACGGRDQTFKNFRNALKSHPDAFNVLLVDSEDAVIYEVPNFAPCSHLSARDNWEMRKINDEQCHLMAQTMETWLICDRENLKNFYGQEFRENALPKTQDIEKIAKKQLNEALENATKNTSKKAYHKMRHGPKLLKTLDVSKARARAAHCERLFATLEKIIDT